MSKYRSSSSSSVGGCGLSLGCFLVIIAFNVILGGYCFNFCLETIWGTHLEWGWAAVGGLFLGELTVPLAVILWLITLSGVPVPFVH